MLICHDALPFDINEINWHRRNQSSSRWREEIALVSGAANNSFYSKQTELRCIWFIRKRNELSAGCPTWRYIPALPTGLSLQLHGGHFSEITVLSPTLHFFPVMYDTGRSELAVQIGVTALHAPLAKIIVMFAAIQRCYLFFMILTLTHFRTW